MNAQRNGPWLLTKSGVKFHLLDPREEDVNIDDIASGLSRICRFNGQLKKGLENEIYSVAQHCVYVDRLVRHMGHKEAAFWGLMHDAAEAYCGDVISPIKKLVPDFEKMEEVTASIIRYRYDIPYDSCIEATVRLADRSLAIMEGNSITSVPSHMWDTETYVALSIEDLDPGFHCWGPKKAREEFLRAFNKHDK